jgi:hypothetical protein
MDIPISIGKFSAEDLAKWVTTNPPDIKVTLKQSDILTISYKPGKRECTRVFDNGKFMIVGHPPTHIYIRAAWYESNGYKRIIITPW